MEKVLLEIMDISDSYLAKIHFDVDTVSKVFRTVLLAPPTLRSICMFSEADAKQLAASENEERLWKQRK